MASKKPADRIFRIAVVGLSGDERTKGSCGVGKSCLCNRFVRPHADHFYKDHISIISQIDFSGRVINNDHFLYWGEVTKSLDDGTLVTCSIVELTEFIDDQSFQPLRGHGDKDYKKRCKTSLSSAEKLMYICKDQLGDEANYDRKIMPDGKFSVDGFIVVFDVSHVQNRPPNKQLAFITELLSSPIHKSKKPCVLVATKCEEPESNAYEEVKQIKDKRKVTLVETSAFENVNVDFAFLTLVNMIDRTKKRPAEVPFFTAIKKQKEILDKVEEAYMCLLGKTVTDYHDVWNRTRKKLAHEDNYQTYLRYFGSEIALKKFKSHTKKLKETQQQRKKQQCLETLPLALKDMLPDLSSIGGRDWKACQEIIKNHPKFDTWFIKLPVGESWRTSDFIDSDTQQIALDFLQTNAMDCEKCFKAHDDRLKEALKRERMKVDFGKLLKALDDVVLPGRQLEETLTHLVDEESYRYLTVSERKEIYDAHQLEITEQAKKEFVELLLENIETFEDFDMDNVNAHMEAIIKHKLQKEPRYKNLDGLIQERRLLLMKHAAFVDNPCRQTCPCQHRCMDELINQLLEQVPKCQEREILDRWSEPSSRLNLIILGENGLADELANEIRAQSVQEEYTLDNAIYSLELRPIEGDVDRPQNHFNTKDFSPQGVICTFRSLEDLRYIIDSLRKSQLALSPEAQESIYATLQPELPVILLFARDLSIPESDISQMRLDVNKLAKRLFDCTIIEIPTDETILWHGKKFHDSQIRHSIRSIVESRRRSGHDRDDDESHDGSQYDPDLRYAKPSSSLYDVIVQSSDKVQSFLGSGSSSSTTLSSRGSDISSSAAGSESRPPGPVPAPKPKLDLTKSKSKFKPNSPQVKRKDLLVQSPRLGEGESFEEALSDDEDADDTILRIGMALMCGDPNLPDLVLGPIIGNETCCRDLDLNQTVNVDMFLNMVKHRVSIEITSFHQAKLYADDVHHGYILVYSTKRRASFETLKFFVKSVTGIPIEIVAVSDSEKFSSDYEMQALIAEGNKLADETDNCTFITAGANFGNQSLAYSTFFTEAYDKIMETEHVHERIFGPIFDDENFEDERPALRTPVEPPPSGFDAVYARPQFVKGVHYPPDKREEALYDQPEKFPTSPRRYPNKGEEYVYCAVQKSPKQKPEPQGKGSKDAGEDAFRRRSKTEGQRGSQDDSNRTSSEEGFVDNVIYDRTPGNGDMVPNPIYDSAENMPQYRPKPPVAPKPRQRSHKGHTGDEGSGDYDPIYAHVLKKHDKVVHEYSEKHLPHGQKGNASSDSDSKGSVEADRDHPRRKKPGSFRKKKNNKDCVAPGQYDDGTPLPPSNQEDRTYDTVVFSPDEDGVDPKVRNRQLREEEKNRKKEEKRQLAASKKRDKAQRQQKQQKQRQQSKKKAKKKPPAYAPYLVSKPKGVALEELVTEDDPVPKFVQKCIEFIDREGVSQEGIYRVSGKQADSDALAAKFNEDPNISIDAMDISCHAAASAVKAFFKNLPNPLIPHELQGELLTNFKGKSSEEFLDSMPEFFNKLPPIRLAILKYLMQHFGRVSANSEMNKMAAQNLTVCWWPTLLHPEFKSLEDVANESQLSAFVEQWVHHSEKLFGVVTPDNQDEVSPEQLETHQLPEDLYAQVQIASPPSADGEVI